MKTLISFSFLAFLLMASSSTIATQNELNEKSESVSQVYNECFNFLRVHRQGKAGVNISWSVADNQIDHFIVERSYDGEFFEPVNSCGFNGSSNYKMNDNNIFPGTIYYRVKAVKTDGTTEHSAVKSVRIVQRG